MIRIILSILFVFIASTGMAQKKKKSYSKPYGMAGCGLWSMILTGKDQGSQLGVWALRTFILNSQTTAISSQLSNCVESGADYAQLEKEIFIEVNIAELTKEASQGEGEHLSALAEVFGCNNGDAFAKLSQDRFSTIFSSMEPNAVLQNYTSEIMATDSLECARLI